MRMTLHSRVRRLLTAGLAAVTLCVAAPRAQAQFGLMGMGGEMGDFIKPSNNARLLKEYARILSLTPEQKRTADELLMAYQSEFRDNVARLEDIYRSINEEVQETGDYELFQSTLPAVMVKFMRKGEKLNQTFMTDLQAILEPAQTARFPEVELLHRRSSSIKMGLEGLQRLDLFETVNSLNLEPGVASGLAPILQQYAGELDRELTARDKLMRSFIDEVSKAMEKGDRPEQDPEMYTKWFKDFADGAKRIEEVNTRYIAQVRGALPEAQQARLDAEVKITKYPAIYRPSYANRVFDAIDRLTDLDAAQKEGLKGLKESFARESAASNDKWATVLDELKAAQGDQMGMFGGGMWMIRNDAKYTEARDARKALDDKSVESVKALLTEAQREKLPKKNYRPEWDFDRAAGQ
jgi:hypothetical protein